MGDNSAWSRVCRRRITSRSPTGTAKALPNAWAKTSGLLMPQTHRRRQCIGTGTSKVGFHWATRSRRRQANIFAMAWVNGRFRRCFILRIMFRRSPVYCSPAATASRLRGKRRQKGRGPPPPYQQVPEPRIVYTYIYPREKLFADNSDKSTPHPTPPPLHRRRPSNVAETQDSGKPEIFPLPSLAPKLPVWPTYCLLQKYQTNIFLPIERPGPDGVAPLESIRKVLN